MTGKEYGSLSGTPMRINHALYEIKYASNYWHKALSTTLSNTKIYPNREDPDIWLRMYTNSRGEKYR